MALRAFTNNFELPDYESIKNKLVYIKDQDIQEFQNYCDQMNIDYCYYTTKNNRNQYIVEQNIQKLLILIQFS